jgi:riboflavin kinase/FMN adenylyltransferase
MRIAQGLSEHQRSSYPVVTIGNFDGHHRGHRALLQAVVDAAGKKNGTPIVLTFDPHPVKVLAPHVELRFLTSKDEKLARFQQAGISEVLFVPFDRNLAAMSPQAFVYDILRDSMGTRELFVGEHFAFGKNRSGHVAELVSLGRECGFTVHPMAPFRVNGEVVSSSRIRTLIQQGDVQDAARYLGRHYCLSGEVVVGQRRGQALGWPTANLPLPSDRVIPADGVYVTEAVWKARPFDSVSYIGTRPTFGSGERLLEVYLLDAKHDLYGESVEVQFLQRLRGDLACATAEDLSAQISADVSQAREVLRTTPRLVEL